MNGFDAIIYNNPIRLWDVPKLVGCDASAWETVAYALLGGGEWQGSNTTTRIMLQLGEGDVFMIIYDISRIVTLSS